MTTRKGVALLAIVFMSATLTVPRPAYADDWVKPLIYGGAAVGSVALGASASKANTREQEQTKRYLGKLQHDVEQSRIHNNAALKAPTAFGGSGTSGVASQWGSTAVTANVAQDRYGQHSYTDVQRGTHLIAPKTAIHRKPTRVKDGRMLSEKPPPPIIHSKAPRKSEGKKKSRASRNRAPDSALDRVDLGTLERLKSQEKDLQTKIALGLYIDGKKNPGKYGEETFEKYWPFIFTAMYKDERGW